MRTVISDSDLALTIIPDPDPDPEPSRDRGPNPKPTLKHRQVKKQKKIALQELDIHDGLTTCECKNRAYCPVFLMSKRSESDTEFLFMIQFDIPEVHNTNPQHCKNISSLF